MRKILGLTLTSLGFLLLPSPTYAVCPVCTVAVGAGLGISRTLGIDDTVTSIWIGGLILSSSFWMVDWMEKKFKAKTKFKYLTPITTLAFYLLVLVPLYFTKVVGYPLNTLWGIDKILVGTFFGSVAFLAGLYLDKKVREVRGKQLFNFQKVVFPVSTLVIFSLLFYFLTK